MILKNFGCKWDSDKIWKTEVIDNLKDTEDKEYTKTMEDKEDIKVRNLSFLLSMSSTFS